MHTQLRATDVDHSETSCRERGSDGATTCAIVLHHKLLEGDRESSGEVTDHQSGGAARSIALVGVGLDHRSCLKARLV